MSLEDLEKELYRKRADSVSNRLDARTNRPVPPPPKKPVEEWEEVAEDEESRHSPFLRRMIWGGTIFALIVIAGGLFFIFRYNTGSRDVTVDMTSLDEVYKGVPFELTLEINNRSAGILHSASLTLSYPDSVINIGGDTDVLSGESVGDVGSGGLLKRTFKFIAMGDIKAVEKISASLSYTLDGNTRFESDGEKDVTVKDSPITITIDRPDTLVSGSTFTTTITYMNVSDFDFPDTTLHVDYPQGFKFVSANLTPTSLNNTWKLGALQAGSKGKLQIKGYVEGGSGDGTLSFPASLSANFLNHDYEIADQVTNLKTSPSPVVLQITANQDQNYIAHTGDQVSYLIHYQNNSGIALADVVLQATLTGEMFDFTRVQTNANIDPITNTFSWNASNVPAFRLLDPGASGDITLGIKLKDQFPIQRLNDKNFSLKVRGQIDSPSVPYYLSASSTEAVASLETKISGNIIVDAQAFYRDADAGIVNAGPLPPKVSVPTEFTVHWILRNYSTDVHGVDVKASLPSGVLWTGQVKGNTDTLPAFNDRTGEVEWKVDSLPATKGVLGPAPEVIFQIRAVPSLLDRGQYKQILGPTSLIAIDDFSGLTLTSGDGELTTALQDDHSVSSLDGRVTP